jgi:3,4-dihydroxy 2-butanone 4-phosphate synthase/GTP cyclohydrolase II
MTDSFFAATAPFRTRSFGSFTIAVTRPDLTAGEHVVLTLGDVRGANVLCRATSRCLTSTALDAYDCDCVDQLRLVMGQIRDAGRGILLYMDQEGRGHGLATKIEAMNLKAAGIDTFSAYEHMGLPGDGREYSDAAQILRHLGVESIVLLTNNPDKARAMEAAGINVTGMASCAVYPPPPGAIPHLQAKRERGHHL